jgi:hypothetical protein
MEINDLLEDEIKGSVEFFLDFTNLKAGSPGYGLTVDSTKKPRVASIASVGFSLTAWVIASERGFLDRDTARNITRSTLATLLSNVAHYRGFFAHYIDMDSGQRHRKCEYSTIDTALCLNGVITAAAYFQDPEVSELAQQLLERVDWNFIVFEEKGRTLFRMAYNPDRNGDYAGGHAGYISQWDMAAEQKMMYLQAADRLDADTARRLYAGFSRDRGEYAGHPVIVNPGGSLFAYQFSEAWLDFGAYRDPDGVDWFENTRQAALANREFCIAHAGQYKTYHASSWGLSAGDSPSGYDVSGSAPCLVPPHHDGTVSIYSALSCLPFIPAEVGDMALYLASRQPQTRGRYGFYDSYNLDAAPPWYSRSIYGIDKGCSMIMLENHLTRLIWDTYTRSPLIQKSLAVLGFKPSQGDIHE